MGLVGGSPAAARAVTGLAPSQARHARPASRPGRRRALRFVDRSGRALSSAALAGAPETCARRRAPATRARLRGVGPGLGRPRGDPRAPAVAVPRAARPPGVAPQMGGPPEAVRARAPVLP